MQVPAPLPPAVPVVVSGGMPTEAIIGIIMLGGLGIWGLTQVLVPIARAWAQRIADGGGQRESALLDELADMRQELDGVRHEVSTLQERVDFSERLLGQLREPARLRPPT